MIRQIIRLVRPGVFLPCFQANSRPENSVLVRPRHLSICAADQRYFTGNRPHKVLRDKLPMALVHEATGIVIHDTTGTLPTGASVVLLPGGPEPMHTAELVENESNYRSGAFFRSSNEDGFCQEMLYVSPEECILIDGEYSPVYVFTELLSVCCHAWRRTLSNLPAGKRWRIGIWGDGPMGYMMALVLRKLAPQAHLTIYGKHDDKLMMFSFVDTRINVLDRLTPLSLDCAFECVGGQGSVLALEQIIDCLAPCGCMTLMGVSETPPSLNTRMILEKGLHLLGCSRSARKDFVHAKELIDMPDVKAILLKAISDIVQINDYISLADVFIQDTKTQYKTILEWKV